MRVALEIHYHDQRTDKKDENNGLLFGVYIYDVPNEEVNTDDMFYNDVIGVYWFETEQEREDFLRDYDVKFSNSI